MWLYEFVDFYSSITKNSPKVSGEHRVNHHPHLVSMQSIHPSILSSFSLSFPPVHQSVNQCFRAAGSLAACLPLHHWPSSFIFSSSHSVLFCGVCLFFPCSFAFGFPPTSGAFLHHSPLILLDLFFSISCSASWSFPTLHVFHMQSRCVVCSPTQLLKDVNLQTVCVWKDV